MSIPFKNKQKVKNFKIIFFLGFTNPFPVAGWRRIESFAKYLAKRGFNVYIIGSFPVSNLEKAGLIADEPYKIINICPTFYPNYPAKIFFNFVISFITLVPMFLAIRADCTVISVPPVVNTVGAFFASKISGGKIIFDYRDEWEDFMMEKSSSRKNRVFYIALKKLFTLMYAKSSAVITVTSPIITKLKERGIEKIYLIPNGADVKIFRPLKSEEIIEIRKSFSFNSNDFLIAYSGSFHMFESYSPDLVLYALQKIVSKGYNVKLVVIGKPLSKNLIDLINSLKLNNYVYYLGFIQNEHEVAKIVSMCDVGVIPYADRPFLRQAIAVKFFEYSACGLPVIATGYDDSILVKILQEYNVGLSSPPNKPDELAENIMILYKDYQLRKNIGLRARKLIQEKFDREKLTEELLKIL